MSTLTAQQIYAQQAKRTLELYLYNPQNKVAAGKHNSRDYPIPPATECWIKVKKGRVIESYDQPGVLPIRGYTFMFKETSKAEPVPINVTPEEIVEHLVGPDRMSGQLGPAGVRLLTGNPELDEIIKRDARETWLRKTYEDALVLRNVHEQLVAAAQSKGAPLPGLSPRVRAAYRTISEYESGGGEAAVKHVCPKCADRLKEDADARAHVLAYHPSQASEIFEKLKLSAVPETKAEASTDEELIEFAEAGPVEAPRRGPGRPRKQVG
jgi:hypothetical protein